MTTTLQTLRAAASPTLAAIMRDTTPPAERLRIAAGQLDGALVADEYLRLRDDQRCELRCLVMMMHDVADRIEESAPVVRWWQRVFAPLRSAPLRCAS